ncbi:hypothetical protein MTR_6g044920 [Medicago truncatula]|uniref:Uncharacterized protein n=1 Tax=Medicago truncatula TaxID=3880 RepID=G7KJK8_MEDTR|nr:hypothetical protein MTR_6g044920 [Medicago truncatula]
MRMKCWSCGVPSHSDPNGYESCPLNGEVEEEIYMEQPECFAIYGQKNKYYKVNESDKCIYYKYKNNIFHDHMSLCRQLSHM